MAIITTFWILLITLVVLLSPLLIGSAVMGWQKSIKVRHKDSGINKNIFIGYSWTYFFFGFFVPIFRGEVSIGFFHLFLSILTFGVFQLVMPFIYNKQFSHRQLVAGWNLDDSELSNALAREKLNIST